MTATPPPSLGDPVQCQGCENWIENKDTITTNDGISLCRVCDYEIRNATNEEPKP